METCQNPQCLLFGTPAVGVYDKMVPRSTEDSILGKTENGQTYRLGKGKVTKGNVLAARDLLKREFPQALKMEHFEPIVIPNVFMRKKPELLKRLADMSPEQAATFERDKAMIIGEESEMEAFSNFMRLFREEGSRDLVLFNGVEFLYPDAEFKTALTGEFDHILILRAKKCIVYNELKTTFSKSHALKKRQFEKFTRLLRDHFPIGEGWRLILCYGFARWPGSSADDTDRRPCSKCAQFVFMVNDYASIKAWFKGIESLSRGNPAECTDQESFQELFATFLFISLINRCKRKQGPFLTKKESSGELFRLIQSLTGSAENAVFWSGNQKVLLDGHFKLLHLSSYFGTGKTVILMEKAKRLAERGENVKFIVAHDQTSEDPKCGAADNFLFHSLTEQFSQMETVHLEFENIWQVLEVVDEYAQADFHIFVDEFSFKDDGDETLVTTKMLNYVSSFRLPKEFDSYFWVAGTHANMLDFLPPPPNPLTQQLRSCQVVSNYATFGKVQWLISDTSQLPWRVICDNPNFLIPAVRWVLSDNGLGAWKNAKSDVFVIDPTGKIDFSRLLEEVRDSEGHGWIQEDISTQPSKQNDAGSHKKIFLIENFGQIQGYEAETVIMFDDIHANYSNVFLRAVVHLVVVGGVLYGDRPHKKYLFPESTNESWPEDEDRNFARCEESRNSISWNPESDYFSVESVLGPSRGSGAPLRRKEILALY